MQLTIREIEKLLPHRYPFLLVDRVTDVSDDMTVIRAIKNVTANEPQFTGHFPEVPVMPGVLIIEAMAQTCAVLCSLRLTDEERARNALFYFAGIDKARFKRIVTPGDQLVFEGRYVRERSGILFYECKATVDGQIACSCEMMCARRDVE